MAGVVGFEPTLKVLETRVLPLTPYPYISNAFLLYNKPEENASKII